MEPLGTVLAQFSKAVLNLFKRCRQIGDHGLELRVAAASIAERWARLEDFDLPLNIGARI